MGDATDPKPEVPGGLDRAPSLGQLINNIDELDAEELPDPEILSPKSAMIVKQKRSIERLMKKVNEKDEALKKQEASLKKVQKKNKALLVKNRSESFTIENLQKQVAEAKEEMTKAVDDKQATKATLAAKQRDFQEKYDELYKAQEAVYKQQDSQAAARQQSQSEA